MATWNVRGTFQEGSVKILLREMRKYKIDIAAIQETKQLGSEVLEIEDALFCKSGGQDRRLGTGFIVRNDLKQRILGFNPISERLCTIRLKGKRKNISIINLHAPTEEKEEDIKDEFYEQLSKEYEKLPKYDVKIILGDANAKIGKEEIYWSTVGKHSKHNETNDNGQRLINLAMEKNMVVRSTQMEKKEIHKGTWSSPDGKTINQIDHILIEKKT